MNEDEKNDLEVRRIRRMLKQMYSLAEHASLTGALSDGAEDAIAAYNRILERLGELQDIPLVIFAPLPRDASFDRLGVASRLLEGYIAEDESDRQNGGNGGPKINFGYNTANINGLEEIKDLGRIIRDNLPDFMRHRFEAPTFPQPPAAPRPPDPPAAPAPPRPDFGERGEGSEFE